MSGSAPMDNLYNIETDQAVASILEICSDDVDIINDRPIENLRNKESDDLNLKRKREGSHPSNKPEQNLGQGQLNVDLVSPDSKKNKLTIIPKLYQAHNEGPFEVIVQGHDKQKINPFTVGKILKTHSQDVSFIKRTGRNITIVCPNYLAANNVVSSPHLKQYIVFVPSNRIESIGVVYVEPSVTEDELLEDAYSTFAILKATRIKKRVNKELIDTHFVKLTFDSEKLPSHVTLNFVRMPVEQFQLPVKQCFNCFSYGHTIKSPCNRDKLCRDCGEQFHGSPCTREKCCMHCKGKHSANNKSCPEYIRQKSIMDRMVYHRESYYEASQYFPRTSQSPNPIRPNTYRRSFASIVQNITPQNFPELPTPSLSQTQQHNRFSILPNEDLPIDGNFSTQKTKSTSNSFIHISQKIQKTKVDPTRNSTKNLNSNYVKDYKPARPQVTNVPNKASPAQNYDHLKPLLKEKLEELRVKITEEKSANIPKKRVQDMIQLMIKNISEEKVISKTTTGLVKNILK